jgi:hypothetical protein
MNLLYAQDLAQFARRYRFASGRLRRVRILPGSRGGVVEILLRVEAAGSQAAGAAKPVRLLLRVDGAEEFRFQKRPITNPARLTDVKFGYFNGLFFINFDAWGLLPGEVPAIHDFRASDAFVAGKSISWMEVPKPAGEAGKPAG